MSKQSKSLPEWLSLLEARHPVEIELGLDRVAEVYHRLGDVRPAPKIVTVGGTNGKGSCLAMLDALLRSAGLKVATYSSPHLLRFNERVRVGGVPVTDQQLCHAFERVETACADTSLTYFEFTTLAAFVIMADTALDVAILEVGLGGRLDAVNIIDADITVITSIDLDHEGWLGNSREAVATEKLGILRRDKPLICGETDLPANFLAEVANYGACGLYRGKDFDLQPNDGSLTGFIHDQKQGRVAYPDLPESMLPLPSVACALQALAQLGVDLPTHQLMDVVARTGLTGRFQQVVLGDSTLILDVAHNPAAAQLMAERLQSKGLNECLAVTAMMHDKDIPGVIDPLKPFVSHWFVGELPDIPRAATATELRGLLYNAGAEADTAATVGEAIEMALNAATPGNVILVFGSFFTVAAALEWLREQGVEL